MPPTLIILNPHAASGRAEQLWQRSEPVIAKHLGDLLVAITHSPQDVYTQIEKAYQNGIRRVIGVGGDGTNNSLVDALAKFRIQHPEREVMTLGNLPVGTGRDWARSQGFSLGIDAAAARLTQASPTAIDIGQIHIDGELRHFLNIASGGMGGEVDKRVNSVAHRRPWTFLQATVAAILTHQPQHLTIKLDGQLWFDQPSMLAVVANGTTFGHGMKIAPRASIDDGLFDVVVLSTTSRLHILRALWHVYNGTHLDQRGVLYKQAKHVDITCQDGELPLDIDGEYAAGKHLTFEVRPQFLSMLL